MSLLTLFTSQRGFVATERLVFGSDEVASLERSHELATKLDELLAAETERLADAEASARAAGHQHGLEEGRAQARQELAARVVELERASREHKMALRSRTTRLAIEIVRKIAGNVAPAKWIASQAVRASEDLIDDSPLTLRVHPDRVDEVRVALDGNKRSFEGVVADDTLTLDACVLDSHVGRVDATLASQLQRLSELDFSADEEPVDRQTVEGAA